uniref:Uncharacterized protein n=1 Tax=viral metagenome TaxID=1070528 RepID=A0A6M3K0K5_9ZZZZ
MAINASVNYPLMRELKQMGAMSSDAAPKTVGPFQITSEFFVGDTSGATKTLTQTPIDDGIFQFFSIPTAFGTNNTLTGLVEDTDYSISDDTITYLTDLSGHNLGISYAYEED